VAGVFAGAFRAGGALGAAPAGFFDGPAGFFAVWAGRAAAARIGVPAALDFDAAVFLGFIVDMSMGEKSLFVLTQLYNMHEEEKDVNAQITILPTLPESLAKAGPDGFGPSIWAGSLFDRADFALSKAWRRRFRHSFGT
jgi:hypothetical protein